MSARLTLQQCVTLEEFIEFAHESFPIARGHATLANMEALGMTVPELLVSTLRTITQRLAACRRQHLTLDTNPLWAAQVMNVSLFSEMSAPRGPVPQAKISKKAPIDRLLGTVDAPSVWSVFGPVATKAKGPSSAHEVAQVPGLP